MKGPANIIKIYAYTFSNSYTCRKNRPGKNKLGILIWRIFSLSADYTVNKHVYQTLYENLNCQFYIFKTKWTSPSLEFRALVDFFSTSKENNKHGRQNRAFLSCYMLTSPYLFFPVHCGMWKIACPLHLPAIPFPSLKKAFILPSRARPSRPKNTKKNHSIQKSFILNNRSAQ